MFKRTLGNCQSAGVVSGRRARHRPAHKIQQRPALPVQTSLLCWEHWRDNSFLEWLGAGRFIQQPASLRWAETALPTTPPPVSIVTRVFVRSGLDKPGERKLDFSPFDSTETTILNRQYWSVEKYK